MAGLGMVVVRPSERDGGIPFRKEGIAGSRRGFERERGIPFDPSFGKGERWFGRAGKRRRRKGPRRARWKDERSAMGGNVETCVLLVDGACVLCHGFATFVCARDPEGKIRFETQQSELGKDILRRHEVDTQLETVVLVCNHGSKACVKTHSDAILETCRRLPWPWKWMYALVVVPRPVRDWCYKTVASHRYSWFGRKDRCSLPDAILKKQLQERKAKPAQD